MDTTFFYCYDEEMDEMAEKLFDALAMQRTRERAANSARRKKSLRNRRRPAKSKEPYLMMKGGKEMTKYHRERRDEEIRYVNALTYSAKLSKLKLKEALDSYYHDTEDDDAFENEWWEEISSSTSNAERVNLTEDYSRGYAAGYAEGYKAALEAMQKKAV